MLRTSLYADPKGRFVHDPIFESCRRVPQKTALVDTSCGRRICYAEYGQLVESLARGLVAAGLKPGEVIAIYLANSWEFCEVFHAASLCGAVSTLLNPSYREREVHHQLENSEAVFLVSDRSLHRWHPLRRTAQVAPYLHHTHRGLRSANVLLAVACRRTQGLPRADTPPEITIAALPYSSGTTGIAKGSNAVAFESGIECVSVHRTVRVGVARGR